MLLDMVCSFAAMGMVIFPAFLLVNRDFLLQEKSGLSSV
jgi:hypothetical protein